MFEHVLETETIVRAPRERVFSFFSDAGNLAQLTPPSVHFRILAPLPLVMKEGAIIDYAIGLRGIPMRWRTRICSWDPPHSFSDEQLKGPYRKWLHVHTFEETPEGHTLMRDHVTYALPLPPLGEIGLPFVRAEVRGIFDFRTKAIAQIFA